MVSRAQTASHSAGGAICDVQEVRQATAWKRSFRGILHRPAAGACQHPGLHLWGAAGRGRQVRSARGEHRPVERPGARAHGPCELYSLFNMQILTYHIARQLWLYRTTFNDCAWKCMCNMTGVEDVVMGELSNSIKSDASGMYFHRRAKT